MGIGPMLSIDLRYCCNVHPLKLSRQTAANLGCFEIYAYNRLGARK